MTHDASVTPVDAFRCYVLDRTQTDTPTPHFYPAKHWAL